LYTLQGDSAVAPVNRHSNMSLRVEDLAELSDGTLVIGTKGAGLLLWKDESFREIGVAQGLVSAMVESLHIDSAQNIWVATFEGISKVSPDGGIVNYTIRDGLPSNEVTGIDSYGERIWAATRGGLIEIRPKKIGATPPPILEEIYVNNEIVNPENIRRLAYSKNNLELKFLSIDYTQDGLINYRYRLGPKAPWSYTTHRTVTYAALAEGTYRFEVQAQNKDGQWSASTLLPFRIRPPFWRAWWFWGLIVLAVGSVAYLFYRDQLMLYRRKIAFQEMQLHQEQERAATEKQISELQAVALRAQMNPHFIFNCLNSIQSFIAAGEKTEASRYLARFAKLVRSILKASMNARISLEEEITMLENYLVLEQMRFDRHFSYRLDVADGINLFDTTIPPLLVQPFVENAIIHGLTEESNAGRIEICYRRVNGRLQITITDNGIGTLAAQDRKQKEASIHKSVGMTLTRKRLALLDQSRQDESVQISDLKDEDGTVLGTQVVINVAA
jgi:signal transduction histidine kinase